MDPASIIALIGLANGLVELATREAALAEQKGAITPEQLADVKARAAVADAEWDAIVAGLPPVA
jgi:hypothetical protein